MKSFRVLVPVLALAVAASAAGCKSRGTARAAQPAPAAPSYAYPSYAPAPPEAYSPPAPPAPMADPSVEEMQARALEAERRARQLAEERADRAEEALRSAPPTSGPGGGWAPAGGGESEATAFAEELRTRCDAEVVLSGTTVLVRMSDAFKSGSDQLKGDVKHATTIHAVAEALMRHPEGSVAVVGHSDGTPIKKTKDKWSDNAHLSRARAETVARLLSEKGVNAHLSVDGRGDVEPLVYPERTSSDRARNRRVEIMVRF